MTALVSGDMRIRFSPFSAWWAKSRKKSVSQGHLSKIERGRIAPSLEMSILLSEEFRKSVDWMLLGEGN